MHVWLYPLFNPQIWHHGESNFSHFNSERRLHDLRPSILIINASFGSQRQSQVGTRRELVQMTGFWGGWPPSQDYVLDFAISTTFANSSICGITLMVCLESQFPCLPSSTSCQCRSALSF